MDKNGYLTKREILGLRDDELLSAFKRMVVERVSAQDRCDKVPLRLLKQEEWIRDEILVRMR